MDSGWVTSRTSSSVRPGAGAVNAFFFVMEKYVIGEVWVAWQWYPLLGVLVTLAVGGALSLRHRGAQSPETAGGLRP